MDDFTNFVQNNIHPFYEENSYSSGSINSPFFPTQSYENNDFLSDSNQIQVRNDNFFVPKNSFSDAFCVPNFPLNFMEDLFLMKVETINENLENDTNRQFNDAELGEEFKVKRKINMQKHEANGDEKNHGFSKSPKKPRLPRDAQKGKRNTSSKKSKKLSLNGNDEENNAKLDDQNHHSSCSSDDNNSNNSSQEYKREINPALNTNGITGASKGTATDPQSLYARRRRERINERLRILQNLVPNGTTVDISTMLEEAVQYVKFLQHQIKLLSSDEMWMFAPIAYNGMDMGLYNKM